MLRAGHPHCKRRRTCRRSLGPHGLREWGAAGRRRGGLRAAQHGGALHEAQAGAAAGPHAAPGAGDACPARGRQLPPLVPLGRAPLGTGRGVGPGRGGPRLGCIHLRPRRCLRTRRRCLRPRRCRYRRVGIGTECGRRGGGRRGGGRGAGPLGRQGLHEQRRRRGVAAESAARVAVARRRADALGPARPRRAARGAAARPAPAAVEGAVQVPPAALRRPDGRPAVLAVRTAWLLRPCAL